MPEPSLTAPEPAAPGGVPPRPPVLDGGWFESLRARWEEPRVRAVVLLLVAGIAGFVWFRLGRSSAASPSAGSAHTSARAEASSQAAATRSARAASATTAAPAENVVHVAGAVARPGVVRVPAGGRVVDAIEAAGGGVPGADLDALNLAAKVVDGQRILVPLVGQPVAPAAEPAAGTGTGDPTGSGEPAAPVNLNTASSSALEELPGIGPALAAAIIRYREEHGGFRSVAELQEVRGIGDARFADLEPVVTV